MTLIGALDRVRADEQSRFLVKGGVSMELRLGLGARSTQDLDIVFRGRTAELLDALEEAFEHPYSGFATPHGLPYTGTQPQHKGGDYSTGERG